MTADYDWRSELRTLCSGMFNLDPFDWAGFDRFVVNAYRLGSQRPSGGDVEALLGTIKPAWAPTLVPAYENGIRLLETLAALPIDDLARLLEEGRGGETDAAARRAVEAAERLLRGQ